MIQMSNTKKQLESSDEKTNKSAYKLNDILTARSKVISVLIVAAVIVPVVAVAAQTSITVRTYPDSIDFRMRDVVNQEWLYLSDYRGKVVLLDFMYTRCPVCMETMPDLAQIHQLYSSQPFVLLSVTASIADNITSMQQFKATYSANWTFAIPFNIFQVAEDYGVDAYPTQVIVDTEGRITYKSVGHDPFALLTSKIDETLGQ